jgi:hypothetical protein
MSELLFTEFQGSILVAAELKEAAIRIITKYDF